MYKYFVSYNHSCEGEIGFGHTEVTTNSKITGINKIREVAVCIEQEFGYKNGSVIIINFHLFDE